MTTVVVAFEICVWTTIVVWMIRYNDRRIVRRRREQREVPISRPARYVAADNLGVPIEDVVRAAEEELEPRKTPMKSVNEIWERRSYPAWRDGDGKLNTPMLLGEGVRFTPRCPNCCWERQEIGTLDGIVRTTWTRETVCDECATKEAKARLAQGER